jgi:hypothetical protein
MPNIFLFHFDHLGHSVTKFPGIMVNWSYGVDFRINPLIRACVCVPLNLTITIVRFVHTLYFRNNNHYFHMPVSSVSPFNGNVLCPV